MMYYVNFKNWMMWKYSYIIGRWWARFAGTPEPPYIDNGQHSYTIFGANTFFRHISKYLRNAFSPRNLCSHTSCCLTIFSFIGIQTFFLIKLSDKKERKRRDMSTERRWRQSGSRQTDVFDSFWLLLLLLLSFPGQCIIFIYSAERCCPIWN